MPRTTPKPTATEVAVPTGTPEPTLEPTPAPTAVQDPDTIPTSSPTAVAVPTAAPAEPTAPAPAAVPTATPQVPAQEGGQSGDQEVVAQLSGLNSALKWVAHFDNSQKRWSAFDPTGTFSDDKGQLPIPVNPPVGTLTSLTHGEIYWIGLSQNATLGGETLLAGLNSFAWRDASTAVATPVPSATPRPTPTAQPTATPAVSADLVEQLAGLGTALKWVAYTYVENGRLHLLLYDPTGTFPGINALSPGANDVAMGPLTRLVEGREYLIAVNRNVELNGIQLVALDSGVNAVKWRKH